jgi:exonuclease SbcD
VTSPSNFPDLRRDPWIVYPGNLQTRMMREAGEKGATLVTVRDGRIIEVESPVYDDVLVIPNPGD